MLEVGILGGSGYGGGELLRILLFHPEVKIRLVTAGEHAGKRVDSVHRNLAGLTSLHFDPMPDPGALGALDCLFLALPHGEALGVVPALPPGPKVVDLSGDFRLKDAGTYEAFYGRPHGAMEIQPQFAYGLTELNRKAVAQSLRVANPGCFATALLLGLYPFVVAGAVSGKVIADLKTGSSGSGAKPAANTHHPKRAAAFYAYKAFEHQHLPEVAQFLSWVDPPRNGNRRLVLQAHSLPAVRGIFASIYIDVDPSMGLSAPEILRSCYEGEFFVRLVEGSPDIHWVKNTNFVDIGCASSGETIVVFVAIDNLVKGAAGQAVQNMNCMFGVAERTGLMFAGGNP